MLFADTPDDNTKYGVIAALVISVLTAIGLATEKISTFLGNSATRKLAARREEDALEALRDGRVSPFLKDRLTATERELSEVRLELGECKENHARQEELNEWSGRMLEEQKATINKLVDTLRAKGDLTDSAVHRVLPPDPAPPKPPGLSNPKLPTLRPTVDPDTPPTVTHFDSEDTE